MLKNFKPLYDKILVKRIDVENKTDSGLYLAGAFKDRPSLGEVVAIGDGRWIGTGKLIPLKVSKGDRVFFTRHGGVDMSEEYLVLREDELLGRIEAD